MIGHYVTSDIYDNVKNMITARIPFEEICRRNKISMDTVALVDRSCSFEVYREKRASHKAERNDRPTSHTRSSPLSQKDFDFVKECLLRGMRPGKIVKLIGKTYSIIGIISHCSTFDEYTKELTNKLASIHSNKESKTINAMFDLIASLEKRVEQLEKK